MRIKSTRIHAMLRVFRLESESWDVLYTPPGHVAVVDSDAADDISQAWKRK